VIPNCIGLPCGKKDKGRVRLLNKFWAVSYWVRPTNITISYSVTRSLSRPQSTKTFRDFSGDSKIKLSSIHCCLFIFRGGNGTLWTLKPSLISLNLHPPSLPPSRCRILHSYQRYHSIPRRQPPST